TPMDTRRRALAVVLTATAVLVLASSCVGEHEPSELATGSPTTATGRTTPTTRATTGTTTGAAVVTEPVQAPAPRHRAKPFDFDGDGRADVAWMDRNT